MVFKLVKEQEEQKKEYELNINNKRYKLNIEVKMDEIIFKLNCISEISYYNYIRKYKYNDIIKELNLSTDIFINLSKIFHYFDNKELSIKEDKSNKVIKINDKDIIILYKNKNEDILEMLIYEINILKEFHKKIFFQI